MPKAVEKQVGRALAALAPATPRHTLTPRESPIPPPSRVQGAQAPAGATACPPVLENVLWQSGRDSLPPRHKPPPIPAPYAGQARKRPCPSSPWLEISHPCPKQGAGGAAPAGGTGGVPLSLKTLEGGPVGQRRPLHKPLLSLGTRWQVRKRHTPLQNTNRCAILPP